MRADALKKILCPDVFDVIDTTVPLLSSPRWARSLGFRTMAGPLISAVNQYILTHLDGSGYDCIWVDKAVFILPRTVLELRRNTNLLVHYTPDAAFYANYSRHFIKTMNMYDFVISTKSYEKDLYTRHLPPRKLLLTTQGYDNELHRPMHSFEEKTPSVVFIGLFEPSRSELIKRLLDHGIFVVLGGVGWSRFVRKYASENLNFIGERVFREDYSWHLSHSYFGLGCLSKRFPEQHTTRTFEIPACRTALLTERTHETTQFFTDEEAIFYENPDHLVTLIHHYLHCPQKVSQISEMGYRKVINGRFDYESLLRSLLNDISLLKSDGS